MVARATLGATAIMPSSSLAPAVALVRIYGRSLFPFVHLVVRLHIFTPDLGTSSGLLLVRMGELQPASPGAYPCRTRD